MKKLIFILMAQVFLVTGSVYSDPTGFLRVPLASSSVKQVRQAADDPYQHAIDVIKRLQEPGKHPKSVLLLMPSFGQGWGDFIMEFRVMVASILKTWPDSIERVIAASQYGEVFRGIDDSKITTVELSKVSDEIKPQSFDLVIDMAFFNKTGHVSRSIYTNQFSDKYPSSNVIDYYGLLSIIKLGKKQFSGMEPFRKMLEEIGLVVPKRTEYVIHRQPKQQQGKIVFVNFLANSNGKYAQQSAVQWVKAISILQKNGYHVILHGGRADDTYSRIVLNDIFKKGRIQDAVKASLEIRYFDNREDIVNFMSRGVDFVVTIDTGIFWAAQEIAGIPSVVITTDRSYIAEAHEDNFCVINYRMFRRGPGLVLMKLLELSNDIKQLILEPTAIAISL